MKYILTLTIILMSLSATAENIADEWQSLNSSYLKFVASKKYNEALQVAVRLNAIDPSDTESMLYIVFASVKAGKTPPAWIMSKPWPNAKSRDIYNRQLADQLVLAVNKESVVDAKNAQHN